MALLARFVAGESQKMAFRDCRFFSRIREFFLALLIRKFLDMLFVLCVRSVGKTRTFWKFANWVKKKEGFFWSRMFSGLSQF